MDQLIREKGDVKTQEKPIIRDYVAIGDSTISLPQKVTKLKPEDKAKKMLQKMGWKGKGNKRFSYIICIGLGKLEQGIVTPLMVKKTGDKYGIIINANKKASPIEENIISIDNFYNRAPTRVLMITNMVNKDEISEEIYHDIKEECENYGIVIVSICVLNLINNKRM